MVRVQWRKMWEQIQKRKRKGEQTGEQTECNRGLSSGYTGLYAREQEYFGKCEIKRLKTFPFCRDQQKKKVH